MIGCDAMRGVERRVEGLAAVVGEARALCELLDVEELVEDEGEVAAVDEAGVHGAAPRERRLEAGAGRLEDSWRPRQPFECRARAAGF